MDGINLVNEKYFRQKNKKTYLQLSEEEKSELDDIQKEWLLQGHVDRTVYFIAKTDDREGLDNESNLEEIFDKNGFVVYRRTR